MNFASQDRLSEIIEPLGWVLVHFLWQGTIIALVLMSVLHVQRRSSAQLRYCSSLAGLAALAMMPLVTLGVPGLSRPILSATIAVSTEISQTDERGSDESKTGQPRDQVAAHFATDAVVPGSLMEKKRERSFIGASDLEWVRAGLRPWLKVLVIGWLIGVLFLSFRLARLWRRVQCMRCVGIEPISSELITRLKELSRKLGYGRRVDLLRSNLVEVPTLIGWLQPVILMPASAVTGLAPSQLDAILVHELAHIRRHDYLVNLLQSAIETLLFYHPAVWWVSSQLRKERENCCDDLAVEILGDPVDYGRALLILEEQRSGRANPALALGSHGGSLLGRIERLVGSASGKRRSTMGVSLSMLVGVLMLSCASMLMVRGEIVAEKSEDGVEQQEELKKESGSEIPENVVQRFEMIFFQDQERRTIPAVTFQLGDEFYAVMSAPATIPSDGVGHAIDRMFLKWFEGIDYEPKYQQKVSAKEFFVYRPSSGGDAIPSLTPDQVTKLAVGDRVSVAEIRGDKEIVRTIDAAEVSGVGKRVKIVYHDGKDSHLFEDLTELNRRYSEGTAVFSNGMLGGFVVAGERFLPQGENRSLIVPAERILEKLQSLLGPNRQVRSDQKKGKDEPVATGVVPVSEQMVNLSLDGEISLNLDGVPLEQGLREIFGEGEIQIEFDEDALEEAMISPKHPVTIQLERVRRRTALRLILEQVRLTWDVRDGVLQITTPAAMSQQLLVKSYSVADLLLPDKPKSVESLIGLLTQTIEPGSWDEHGGIGRIKFDPRSESLVIRQVSSLHVEIESCLSQLRSQVLVNRPITVFFEEIPLREAIDRLSKLSGMRLYLDPLGLAEAGVKADMTVSLDARDLRFHAAVMQILEPLHLSYRKEAADEIVRITSVSRAKGKLSTRTYEGFGDLDKLKEVIEKTIDPESWDQVGGEGKIQTLDLTRTLVIRQSEDTHVLIQRLLDEQRREVLKMLPRGPYPEQVIDGEVSEQLKPKPGM